MEDKKAKKYKKYWYLSAIEINSIPRLHDEDVSTIATHRPTKTVLQMQAVLQKAFSTKTQIRKTKTNKNSKAYITVH